MPQENTRNIKHWLCLRGHCTTLLNINNSRLSKLADLMAGMGYMRSNLGQPIKQGGSTFQKMYYGVMSHNAVLKGSAKALSLSIRSNTNRHSV